MEALLPLLLLACPVGMGLMMWMMMRGNHGHADARPESGTREEIAALRAELARRRDQPAGPPARTTPRR